MHPGEEILVDLDRQRHRRFIKTHTPLDGLPFDERVSYVCVGRDPRDAAISWDHHANNLTFEAVMALRSAAVGSDELPGQGELAGLAGEAPPPESERDRFWAWVDADDLLIGLAPMMHHLLTFWRERDRSNIVLLHYDDLKDDLEGQMRGLAARLGITVAEERWPQLVRWATFDTMRGHAATLTPEVTLWRDPTQFFRRGSSGQWRALMDADDLLRYQARVRQLAEPDLIEWAHHGPVIS
jgi:hypothetical protein